MLANPKKPPSRLSLWGASFFALLLGTAWVGGVMFMIPHLPTSGVLRCEKAYRTCFFKRSYIGQEADWANVSFSDIVNLRHHMDRGLKANFSYLIVETKVGNFQMSMPSEYLTKKKIAQLKAYFKHPVADNFVIEEPKKYFFLGFLVAIFLMGSFFVISSISLMMKLCLNKLPGELS